jgi:methionine synthase I (cobalamin-dependent)/5,10-methylenetetrahydrofolate reductase
MPSQKNASLFNNGILFFDGAVGTELYERGFYINRPFEELNTSTPADVLAVHKSYIEAGAKVITTNTFSIPKTQLKNFDIESKQAELLTAGLKVAAEAVKDTDVKVALSVGPIGALIEPLGPTSREDVKTEYASIAKIATECGYRFDLYALETFTNLDELSSAIDGIRSVDKNTPILACVSPKLGNTNFSKDFVARIGSRPDVDAVGMNCSEGPSELLAHLKEIAPLSSKPIIVQPNAGIPRQLNGRYFYMTSPDYLAKFAKRFVEAGAAGVGGCCGTGPTHIKAIAGALRMVNAKRTDIVMSTSPAEEKLEQAPRRLIEERSQSEVGKIIGSGQKFISIELTSPKGTDLAKFLAQIDLIEAAGIRFVNVPDGARAATRVSSLHLAAHVHNRKHSKIKVLPHFTTRDRNLIALQADLLGASINGVNDLLLVTGDPPKLGNNQEATGVYDIDSIGLTHLVDFLNRGVSPTGDVLGSSTNFGIGVASNPTAANLEVEIRRWNYKVEMGADFSVSQPIYDPEAFLRWRDRIQKVYKPHFIGIWPFVSLRNAEFMANEVPGVSVPMWAIEEMRKGGDNKEDSIKRGVDIALNVMRQLESECEGFCISAPLGKVEVALDLYQKFSSGKKLQTPSAQRTSQ